MNKKIISFIIGLALGCMGGLATAQEPQLVFPWYAAHTPKGEFISAIFVDKQQLVIVVAGIKNPLKLTWEKLHKAEKAVQDPNFKGFTPDF